ncbi:MAG: ABC transporter ATP-binding protein [Myxococcales bacterium]|nr:ABC transporter ATP-binding protein [Myxococcales bacterium]
MISVAAACWRPDGAPIIDGLDLELEAGRITAILGRSGCGKSSLLRLLAGVGALHGGSITGRPSRVGFVFQDPALLPWRTVRQNVGLPAELGLQTDPGAVQAAIDAVGLTGHADKLPAALSGGQRMRVSLARALVTRPQLLLLDEPFAALDAATRLDMQRLMLDAHAALACTTVLVTHDVADAARLADRILRVDGPPLAVVAELALTAPRPRSPDDVAAVVRTLEEA